MDSGIKNVETDIRFEVGDKRLIAEINYSTKVTKRHLMVGKTRQGLEEVIRDNNLT